MKKIKKFSILAFALAALAGMFPQTAAASGSLRRIIAVDPDTGLRVAYGSSKPLGVNETIAFQIRALNYSIEPEIQNGALTNYWVLMPGPDWVTTNMVEFLPKIGLWVGGRLRYATYDPILSGPAKETKYKDGRPYTDPYKNKEAYYTDLVFKYTIQSGDMAGPIEFSNLEGTGPLSGEANQTYKLENVGTYWRIVDSATKTKECMFVKGTKKWNETPRDPWECAPPEVTDGEFDTYLKQAGFYVWTVNFDKDQVEVEENPTSNIWRKVEGGSTEIADGGARPTIEIQVKNDATESSHVYLWTEDSSVAYLPQGTATSALDLNGNPKTYRVYETWIDKDAQTATFNIAGELDATGKTTTVYLSSTPTFIWNGSGTLITNFVKKTIEVVKPANKVRMSFVNDNDELCDGIMCDNDFEGHKARFRISVPAFANTMQLTLNATAASGEAVPIGPEGVLNISSSQSGAHNPYSPIFTIPPHSDTLTLYYYVFGLGFATNSILPDADGNVITFSATLSGDGGFFDSVDSKQLIVSEVAPALDGLPPSKQATAGEPTAISFYVTDSYANLTAAEGYEVRWTDDLVKAGEQPPEDDTFVKLGNVKPSRQPDGRYKMTITLNYSDSGTFDTYVYLVGADGKVSPHDQGQNFFPATVRGAKRVELVTDHDDNAELPRQYYENEVSDPVNVKVYLRDWGDDNRNRTGSDLYVFLVPQADTAKYVSSAKFITTTPNASSKTITSQISTN